jgi:hypothetical protein
MVPAVRLFAKVKNPVLQVEQVLLQQGEAGEKGVGEKARHTQMHSGKSGVLL